MEPVFLKQRKAQIKYSHQNPPTPWSNLFCSCIAFKYLKIVSAFLRPPGWWSVKLYSHSIFRLEVNNSRLFFPTLTWHNLTKWPEYNTAWMARCHMSTSQSAQEPGCHWHSDCTEQLSVALSCFWCRQSQVVCRLVDISMVVRDPTKHRCYCGPRGLWVSWYFGWDCE